MYDLMGYIAEYGHPVMLFATTGTVCPCTEKEGNYSPEWHRQNPTAEDCLGAKLINRQIKERIIRVLYGQALTRFNVREYLASLPAGVVPQNALLAIGAWDEAAKQQIKLESYERAPQTTVEINGIKYVITAVTPIITHIGSCELYVLRPQ